jgi:phospholipase C
MEQRDRTVAAGITRRTFLKRTAAAGAAVAGGTLWRAASASPGIWRAPSTQIDHLIISCQENRSFDHYFGYAPEVQAEGFESPPGYFQPDSGGGEHPPFEFTSPTTADPPHSWDAVHLQYDNGAMDGFWQTSQAGIGDGDAAIGYYPERELPSFYCSLLDDSALCANYFCSVLGPTWPNRFYFAAGTSGGDHDERGLGIRRLRLPDHPRPAGRGRDQLGRLQHELGLGPLREHRQRLRLLEALRP